MSINSDTTRLNTNKHAVKQLATDLDELAYLFAEYALQCEYEAMMLEYKLTQLRARDCK